jgi:hypothetical protein
VAGSGARAPLTPVPSSYLCPVLTWWRMLEMGAHHALSWPLLQALFMMAKPLPATSTTARINKEAFMCGLRCLPTGPPVAPFIGVQMNPK